ncbi:uncharacterized protein LOC135361382 [Latimeria chalumnae]|uniref:uncharacterized protein LOC135361382 n=1 Tax=Latimeria chalumnae TaxID=7897 RepID=UPI00313ABC44
MMFPIILLLGCFAMEAFPIPLDCKYQSNEDKISLALPIANVSSVSCSSRNNLKEQPCTIHKNGGWNSSHCKITKSEGSFCISFSSIKNDSGFLCKAYHQQFSQYNITVMKDTGNKLENNSDLCPKKVPPGEMTAPTGTKQDPNTKYLYFLWFLLLLPVGGLFWCFRKRNRIARAFGLKTRTPVPTQDDDDDASL